MGHISYPNFESQPASPAPFVLIIPHDPFTPTVKNYFSPRLTILALSPLNSSDCRTTRAWTDFCLSPSNFLPLTLTFSLSLFPPRSIIPSSLEHCLLPNQLSSVILFLFFLPSPLFLRSESTLEIFVFFSFFSFFQPTAAPGICLESFPSPGMRFPTLVCP